YSFFFFFSSRRRHTRSTRDWSSDVCSSDLFHFQACVFGVGPEDITPLWILKYRSAIVFTIFWRGCTPIGPASWSWLWARCWSSRSEERRVGTECGVWWCG